MKRSISFFLSLFLICAGFAHADLRATSGAFGPATITSGSITGVSGVAYVWKKYHIPIIVLATGTMGNNGALTVGTALPTTYADSYVVVPAGAIAAGVPAATDIYYAQFSSTTVGTVCNNRLADNLDSVGGPTIPASCTAFATTGPGAYTGVIVTTPLLTLALPAATLATTGMLDTELQIASTATANNKTLTFGFGAAANIFNNTFATGATQTFVAKVRNRNSASVQAATARIFTNNAVTGMTEIYLTQNTGNAVNVIIQLGHGTATDNAILEGVDLRVTN